jgi:hypothetical protein
MTKIEVERYLEGAVWRMKQKAQFDYSLAYLHGAAIARIFDSNNKFPEIQEVYPDLFQVQKAEEVKVDTATTNSVNNFLAFAMKHNAKLKGVENKEL